MNLKARQVTLADFPNIYRFVFETFQIYDVEPETRAEWMAFQTAREKHGMVVLGVLVENVQDNGERTPVAYQQVRFVSDAFVESYLTDMPGWLLIRAKEAIDREEVPGLTEVELIRQNEDNGVHLLIDYYGWDNCLSDEDAAEARDYLYRSFQYLCRGYNLRSMLLETIHEDSAGTSLARNAGFKEVRKHRDGPIFHQVTREQSLSGTSKGTLVAALFAGGRPRLNLTPFDRCLILAALWDHSDKDLVVAWPCAEKTITGYWRNIYLKVERDAPSLLPKGNKTEGTVGKRGPERKERLLSFIRNNPKELGPVTYLPLEWRDPPRERQSKRK